MDCNPTIQRFPPPSNSISIKSNQSQWKKENPENCQIFDTENDSFRIFDLENSSKNLYSSIIILKSKYGYSILYK